MRISWTNKEINIFNMHGATMKIDNECFLPANAAQVASVQLCHFSAYTARHTALLTPQTTCCAYSWNIVTYRFLEVKGRNVLPS